MLLESYFIHLASANDRIPLLSPPASEVDLITKGELPPSPEQRKETRIAEQTLRRPRASLGGVGLIAVFSGYGSNKVVIVWL